MCVLDEKLLTRESFTGYKVAAINIKTGVIKSPATGLKYPGVGKGVVNVTVPERQIRIGHYFVGELLKKKSWIYNDRLSGKTAVFRRKSDAVQLLKEMAGHVPELYRFKVIKMKLTGELASGYYQEYSKQVIAGTKMEVLCVL